MIWERHVKQLNIFLFSMTSSMFYFANVLNIRGHCTGFLQLCNRLSQTQLLKHTHSLSCSFWAQESGHTSEGFSASRSHSGAIQSSTGATDLSGARLGRGSLSDTAPSGCRQNFSPRVVEPRLRVLAGHWLGAVLGTWRLLMGPFPLHGLSPNMAVYSFKASMEGLPGLLSPQSAKCYYRNDTPSPFDILLARSKSQLLPYTQKMDFC